MTDNEKFPGGGLRGLNLTRIPGIIHGERGQTRGGGFSAQLSRPRLKRLAGGSAAVRLRVPRRDHRCYTVQDGCSYKRFPLAEEGSHGHLKGKVSANMKIDIFPSHSSNILMDFWSKQKKTFTYRRRQDGNIPESPVS